MSGKDGRLADYLEHISQAALRIRTYMQTIQKGNFIQNQLVQDAVIRNLEIIGEASRNILRDHSQFAAANPDLPLRSAYEMRNVLAHGYFETDLDIVWQTISVDIPVLKQ